MITYFLLGLSPYPIWSTDSAKKDRTFCLYLFVTGLILNLIWISVFFGLKSPFMALMTVIMPSLSW